VKRLLIVTAVWVTLSGLFWLGFLALSHQWQGGTLPKPGSGEAFGLFMMMVGWGFTALLLGVWWLIGLTRWIFGKPREKRRWVEQIPVAPPVQRDAGHRWLGDIK